MAPFSFSKGKPKGKPKGNPGARKSSKDGSSRTGSGRSGSNKARPVKTSSGDKRAERSDKNRPSSGRPSSGRPSSGRPSSGRASQVSRDRKSSDKRSASREFSTRGGQGREFTQSDVERRIRDFETPYVPAEITGEELEKKIIFQLESLTPGNAKSVARHLVALEQFLESDPERAYLHGKEISFRAGRLGIVRERAGVAALRAGHYKEALKDLRAAARITGGIEIQPFIAQCEASLGNARKALEIAGGISEQKLSKAGRVEMRIAAAKARERLGQLDAAVLTLKCNELNTSDQSWSKRLHHAYRDALIKAGRGEEAREFERKFPQSFITS